MVGKFRLFRILQLRVSFFVKFILIDLNLMWWLNIIINFHSYSKQPKVVHSLLGKICNEYKMQLATTASSPSAIESKWICQECNITFTFERNLKSHQKTFHDPLLLRYLCPECVEEFKLPYNLKEHFKIAHKSKPAPNIEETICYRRNTRSGIVFVVVTSHV